MSVFGGLAALATWWKGRGVLTPCKTRKEDAPFTSASSFLIIYRRREGHSRRSLLSDSLFFVGDYFTITFAVV